MTKRKLSYRKPRQSDQQMLYHYANDTIKRGNSINSEFISAREHVVWFQSYLSDNNKYMLLVEDGKILIGLIRFEVVENEAIISLYLTANYRGRGFGSQIIVYGIKYIKKAQTNLLNLTAFIKEANKSSVSVFEKAKFGFVKSETSNGAKLLRYEYHY